LLQTTSNKQNQQIELEPPDLTDKKTELAKTCYQTLMGKTGLGAKESTNQANRGGVFIVVGR
jgi:hypothetical protein